jgi:hypothetical protein
MPYITKEQREIFDEHIDKLFKKLICDDGGKDPVTNDRLCGELNYIIYRLSLLLFYDNTNYAKINTIVGAIESAKTEFQRRVVAPYEDQKIDLNGDIV